MTALHGGMRHDQAPHHSVSASDLDVLSLLTGDRPLDQLGNSSTRPTGTKRKKQSDRRPPVDPLMVAAAASAGPDNTRNHYLHSFYPQSLAYSSCDGERLPTAPSPNRPKMESRQAPRHIRLLVEEEERKRKELADKLRADATGKSLESHAAPTHNHDDPPKSQVRSLQQEALVKLLRQPSTPPLLERSLDFSPPLGTTAPSAVCPGPSAPPPAAAEPTTAAVSLSTAPPLPPLEVQCRVRTRIPTPHGHIFLHLYTNNHDTKEHLAFVADHAQMASTSVTTNAVEGEPILTRGQNSNRPLPFIRSRSLDSKWHAGETDEERIIRGAYVGRLSATSHVASTALGSLADYLSTPPSPSLSSSLELPTSTASSPPSSSPSTIDCPLVRIHSECFTGETIGSQRCDCGEQLDEAFRLITSAGRGVVVYLRQEGRGIGLLEKMRAYNLQDLGHDTVTANLMLGHGADLRTYGIAGAILRDLGIAGTEEKGGVRLLTNNPDKITQIEKEGVRVAERVAMVPRSWILAEREESRRRRHRNHHHHHLGKDVKEKKGRRRGGGGGSTSKRSRGKTTRSTTLLDESVGSLASSTLDSEQLEDPSSSRRRSVESSSVPLSVDPSRSPSPSRVSTSVSEEEEEDYSSSYSGSSDNDEDDEDGRSESSTAYNLRHSGVGMIGRSTTASPELEKYLRTKIERMGHMLVAPTDSSSASSVNGSRSEKRSVHPLSESTTSLEAGGAREAEGEPR